MRTPLSFDRPGRHRLAEDAYDDTEELYLMVSSQNGFRANDRSVISTRTVPGTSVRLAVRNGAPGDLLLEVAARFHREVEAIDGTADDWGYAERNIRGSSTTLSNHASGTAIDLNATRHVLGRRGTFTAAQTARVRAIVGATGGVVRWGGDYTGRADEMHFEINDGRTEQQCADALARLRGDGVPAAATAAAPAASRQLRLTTPNMRGADVAALQRAIGAKDDGIFGPDTDRKLRAFQAANGLEVDGIAGPKTFHAAHLA